MMPVIARSVKVATPEALVVATSVPPRVPPPEASAAVTFTPAWPPRCPPASRSWSTGCWAKAAPLAAVAEGCVVMPSWVAAPAAMVTVPDVTPVRPGALKLSVRSPAPPVMARLVKLATPLALVVAVSVPPRAGLPLASAAVTTHAGLGHGVADRVAQLEHRLLGEGDAAGDGGRGLGGDGQLGGGAGRDRDRGGGRHRAGTGR